MSDVPSAIPVTSPIGEVRTLQLGSEEIVAVGSAPSGYTVLFWPADWAVLQRWKLTRLRTTRGQVWAWGGGSGRLAARFLTGTDNNATKVIRYRNGNAFDLRRSNIVVVPQGLVQQARVDTRDPSAPLPMVYRADGTFTPNRRYKLPARERLRRLLND